MKISMPSSESSLLKAEIFPVSLLPPEKSPALIYAGLQKSVALQNTANSV